MTTTLLQIIDEQKKEFEQKFTGYEFTFNNPVTLKENIQDWHTTAQQQLIDVIIQEVTDMRAEMPHNYSTQELQDVSFDSYQNVINLLQDTINSIKTPNTKYDMRKL